MSASDKPVTRTVVKHLLVVVGMFGFGYLMVPLYDIICDVAGLNGKTGRAEANVAQAVVADADRQITVEFVGIINGYGGWEFAPNQVSMRVHPGKLYNTSYFARNLSNFAVAGQAVPSVAPSAAAKYFNKTECFCFTRQVFEAGGERDMPLTFIIDPDIPHTIDTVTLSYTFFKLDENAGAPPAGEDTALVSRDNTYRSDMIEVDS
ncbi:MAG TPA: cytochrome c oxidase assembly protein [Gammaproteobacteria bacterium]|nr:cytochrome c oxidase assembly protein [Gammaproteobacteria bacterium]